jgi:hypothetical protein
LWQLVQLSAVVTWLATLPVAEVPLWQLAQLVDDVNMLWLTLVPVQVLVDLWQLSQAAAVLTWPPDLPVAVAPLWQLVQLLVAVTLAWNCAGFQPVDL